VPADDGMLVLRADADRDGGHSPVPPLERDGDRVARSEISPGPGPHRSAALPRARSVGPSAHRDRPAVRTPEAGTGSADPETTTARHPARGAGPLPVRTELHQRCGPMPCELRLSMMRADSSKPITTTASGAKSTICWISAS